MRRRDVADGRILLLNERGSRAGDYVLYWMQQAQRAKYNHALEHAIARANELKLPLLVGFGLTDGYPEANLRHYIFMLEGLRETAAALRKRGIKFVLQRGDPASVALSLGRRAALVVCDRGYLRLQKAWAARVARKAKCAVEQVESDVIVPVEVASDKREFAARTLRPKLQRLLSRYLIPLGTVSLQRNSLRLNVSGLGPDDPDALCRRLKLDRSVTPVTQFFRGGTAEAEKIFRKFLHASLADYAINRNQPQTDDVSHMSKYLHFGQISPLWLALEMQKRKSNNSVTTFLEELIVRRELAMNYVEFTNNYDRFDALPDWARRTLRRHGRDERPVVYSRRQLEEAKTHDRYWNAAMQEMRTTGYLHNHMRMYWGKKILEWSRTPEQAFAVALALNNKWFLDGRDANSFANIGWIFGQHDRPWGERPIFGNVRYMNARGLERKCDIGAYVEKVRRLSERRC